MTGDGPRLGDPAPAFELPGTGGKTYRLADYAGAPVVLVFYPADNSPVCTLQLRSYSESFDGFTELGATVLALSPQGVDDHEAFAQRWDLRMPLLADVDREVAAAYGVLGPLGFYRRCVFVVDAQGRISYSHRSMTSMTFVPFDSIQAALGQTLAT